ncbi:MAG: GGDEF domain-containing protein [Lachnospiraceae bacterium]|nr:GGDEF domain-containing protein [Lachnospiraceae bacterium]
MNLDYTFFYTEANIVCIIVFALLLIKDLGGVGRQAKQIAFIIIVISHMLYFVSDICWVLIMAELIPKTAFSASLVNITNAILLSFITGYWFVYVELSQGEKYIMRKKARLVVLMPAMFETVIIIFLFVVTPDLVIDNNNQPTTAYYLAFLAIPLIYVAASAARSFFRAVRKENFLVRKQYLVCAIYPVVISIAGVLQTMWIAAPFFCFGSTIMILYVYIIALNDQVSIDELTHLNNRTQLKKYIAGETSRQNNDKSTHYVLMIDLNKFKQINDKYGHVEGDFALRRAADALKSACAGNTLRTFIARYGGDEFIIITKTENEELVKELCSEIKATLIRLNDEAGAKYELTASIGYSSFCGDIYAFQSALTEADEALYRDKKADFPA